jgi:peptidyl-tRNA hydrolase, PTH1 family
MISLIVGLGNPGIKYAETRHNLGYDLLDKLSLKWKARQKAGLGDYYLAEKEIEGRIIRLVWPTTYMNASGNAVIQAMVAFNLKPSDILIAYDDFELPFGNLRIRLNGSAGSHNGMESVIAGLGTEEIVRLRMGTGPLPDDIDPIQFVLGRFSDQESEIKNKMLDKAAEAVLYLLTNRPEEAMNIYNVNPAPDND